jgi:hypothetical protein
MNGQIDFTLNSKVDPSTVTSDGDKNNYNPMLTFKPPRKSILNPKPVMKGAPSLYKPDYVKTSIRDEFLNVTTISK